MGLCKTYSLTRAGPSLLTCSMELVHYCINVSWNWFLIADMSHELVFAADMSHDVVLAADMSHDVVLAADMSHEMVPCC